MLTTYFDVDGSYVGSFDSPDTEAELLARGCTAVEGGNYTKSDRLVAGVVVTDSNAPILAQIDAIESAHPFTHRYFREQLLAAVQAGIIPANHPVARIAALEDAAVQQLRSQIK